MISEKKRIEEVDILRGIAAVLMILGHCFIEYPIDISGVAWCAALRHFIYTFHMELFFVLAGAVYHCTNYVGFMKKKVERIAVPYIFFGVVALLLRAFGGSAINGVESVGSGVYKLVFRGGGYWFLYTIFLIFAIYPWIDKALPRKWMKLTLLVALLILGEFITFPSIFAIGSIAYYLPYFILGHCCADALRGGYCSEKNTRRILALASILLFIGLDYVEVSGILELGVILSFIRAIAIIHFLYIIVKIVSPIWKKNRLTKEIRTFLTDSSRFSLQYYLFNGYLLVIFRIAICQVLNISAPVIIVLGIWIGNMAVSLVACKWIIPKIPIARKLCGL